MYFSSVTVVSIFSLKLSKIVKSSFTWWFGNSIGVIVVRPFNDDHAVWRVWTQWIGSCAFVLARIPRLGIDDLNCDDTISMSDGEFVSIQLLGSFEPFDLKKRVQFKQPLLNLVISVEFAWSRKCELFYYIKCEFCFIRSEFCLINFESYMIKCDFSLIKYEFYFSNANST